VDLAFENGDTVSKRKDLAQVLWDYIRVFRANLTHYFPHDDCQLQLLQTFNYEEYLNERIEAPDDLETHFGSPLLTWSSVLLFIAPTM